MSKATKCDRGGVGQHYNQAAYMGAFYSGDFIQPPYRELKIKIIPVSSIASIGDSEDVNIFIEENVDFVPACEIFTGYFICKEVEKNNKFNAVESVFFEKFLKLNHSKELNSEKIASFIKNNRDDFNNFLALHLSRNVLNFANCLNAFSNKRVNNFLNTGYFDFIGYLNKQDKNSVKNLYEEALKSNELDCFNFVKSVKDFFNLVYPLKYKSLVKKFRNFQWVIMNHSSKNVVGQSFCFNVKDFNVQAEGKYFNSLPKYFQEIFDDIYVFFAGTDYVLIGFPPEVWVWHEQRKDYFSHVYCKTKNIFNSQEWSCILTFLFEFNLKFSFPHVILSNSDIETNIAYSLDRYRDDMRSMFIFSDVFKKYEEYKYYLDTSPSPLVPFRQPI